ELWRTDGTTPGTTLVKDIYAGIGSSSPSPIVNVGGKLFFTALDPASGRELWTSDGTTAGTALVLDANPGSGSGAAATTTAFVGMGGYLYYVGNDGVNGFEPWRSDGTAANTKMIKDINAGSASSSPSAMIVVGSKIIFAASDVVYGA